MTATDTARLTMKGDPVEVTYTNWRGETAEREIRPLYMWFGSTEWHPEPQWLITAVDIGKGVERDFALAGFGASRALLAEAAEGLIDTAASLAAAISLLERTPKAKKAAPSDKMFAQMLADYNAALNRARELVTKLKEAQIPKV